MAGTKGAVAVIGAGTMGHGIAQVLARGGYDARVFDADAEALGRAKSKIEASLDRGLTRGVVTREQREAALSRIAFAGTLEDALDGCRFVIEAVTEDTEVKRSVFEELDALAPAEAILASNTSALSITLIASWTRRPGQVLGLHFFNPPDRLPLVEIVRGVTTDDWTIDAARELCEGIDKEAIVVADRPGFATSRLSAAIGNEAWHMFTEGVASPEEIDTAVKLGLGHPMGPFELGDLIGLDTRLSVLRYLHQTLGERFRPAPLLVKYVEAGYLGRKTGRGVYEYRDGRGRRDA